jgi:hypothetical protein
MTKLITDGHFATVMKLSNLPKFVCLAKRYSLPNSVGKECLFAKQAHFSKLDSLVAMDKWLSVMSKVL